jgi:hypothetical protein
MRLMDAQIVFQWAETVVSLPERLPPNYSISQNRLLMFAQR